MVCKTCKLLVAGRCTHLGLPVGNLDPSCELYDGPSYEGRHMPGTRFSNGDEADDELSRAMGDDDDYYDDEEEDDYDEEDEDWDYDEDDDDEDEDEDDDDDDDDDYSEDDDNADDVYDDDI